jgi:hypothetical protein
VVSLKPQIGNMPHLHYVRWGLFFFLIRPYKDITKQTNHMKNLAEFKKLATIGSKWTGIRHLGKFAGRDENGKAFYTPEVLPERELSIIQTNSIAFKHTNTDGKVIDSWLQFPKAKECKFPGGNTIEIYEGDVLCLTYTKV